MHSNTDLAQRTLDRLLATGQPVPDTPEMNSGHPLRVPESETPLELHPGVWVEFFSPLFGMCTARIHEVTVNGCIITNHSVLKGEGEPVTIPASWICDFYREQQAS